MCHLTFLLLVYHFPSTSPQLSRRTITHSASVGSKFTNTQLSPFPVHRSASASDNFVSTNASEAGYERVRVACYVQITGSNATVPLQLYYNAKRRDHLSTASPEGVAYATSNDYVYLGTETVAAGCSNCIALSLFLPLSRYIYLSLYPSLALVSFLHSTVLWLKIGGDKETMVLLG